MNEERYVLRYNGHTYSPVENGRAHYEPALANMRWDEQKRKEQQQRLASDLERRL